MADGSEEEFDLVFPSIHNEHGGEDEKCHVLVLRVVVAHERHAPCHACGPVLERSKHEEVQTRAKPIGTLLESPLHGVDVVQRSPSDIFNQPGNELWDTTDTTQVVSVSG